MPESYLYMTTRGRKSGQPREIEIWFTERAGRFYVIAEHITSNWVQNVRAESRVRVRVGVRQFAAQARILPPEADPELVQTIQNLSREKYGWGDGLVVELVPQET